MHFRVLREGMVYDDTHSPEVQLKFQLWPDVSISETEYSLTLSKPTKMKAMINNFYGITVNFSE